MCVYLNDSWAILQFVGHILFLWCPCRHWRLDSILAVNVVMEKFKTSPRISHIMGTWFYGLQANVHVSLTYKFQLLYKDISWSICVNCSQDSILPVKPKDSQLSLFQESFLETHLCCVLFLEAQIIHIIELCLLCLPLCSNNFSLSFCSFFLSLSSMPVTIFTSVYSPSFLW